MSASDQKLFMLAFDHRKSIRPLFGIEGDPDAEGRARIEAAKLEIFEALLRAKKRFPAGAQAGLLVDEEAGTAVLERAREHDDVAASVAVERSGQKEFQFEYGDAWREHIERFRPEFAKALVRYNVEGDAELNARQRERLKELSDYLQASGQSDLLFELLVPPEPEQLEAVGGDRDRFDTDVRPGLVVRAIEELNAAGIRSATWKIEGLETREDCERVAAAVRAADPEANCLILGRGADRGRVEHWLTTAAPVAGFNGFAVGRTIWWDTIAGGGSREEIADNYLHLVEAYLDAA